MAKKASTTPAKAIKPLNRTQKWERFIRGVAALAKDLDLPQAYEVKKVRERGKPRGEAWKDFERAIALAFRDQGFTKADRISRGNDLGESDVDVDVPELPALKVDCKYQVDGWSVMTLFEEVEAKYVASGTSDFLVMPLKSGGKSGSVSVIRTEKLIEVLAQAFLRQGESHTSILRCPLCPGELVDTGSVFFGARYCQCKVCQALVSVANPPKKSKRNAA